jgi:ABC-type transport system substrate-binding protein
MGLRQLSGLLSLESLARPGEDGRMQPWLAESWTPRSDGRALIVKLRPNVKFHDGSPLDAAAVAAILPESLRASQAPAAENVESIRATDAQTIEIVFKSPSPFSIEALEALIQKPDKIGTGPFVVPKDATELLANKQYYQQPAKIDAIRVSNYPSVRAAWAELMRNNIDWLWEAGPEAVDFMKVSSTISTFTYTRHYQNMMILNSAAPALRSKEVRRALSLGIDRDAVIKNAMNGYGVVSSGPVSPRHWAMAGQPAALPYDPKQAAEILHRAYPQSPLRFTALVAPDSLDERIALELKRQLAILGVDMNVEEASREEVVRRCGTGQYDAAVLELIEGPTPIRTFMVWRSNGSLNLGHLGHHAVDMALDRIRYAANDDEYRREIIAMQQTFVDDPPAVFLAWSVRARALSKRFIVPPTEPGRDILGTLRLWMPASNGGSIPH